MSQTKEYHINNSTVKIIFGNILDSLAEVIVNSSGSQITMSGGLTKAIRMAGGEEIRNDAQRKLPVSIGDVVVTTAGKLRQKYVFHCITIDTSFDRSNTPKDISEEDIHQYIIGHGIDKCFQLLHAMDLKSIAFPAIGAGGAGIPFGKVAKVMTDAIARNLRKTNKSLTVELYLLDCRGEKEPWDFLPMFEHLAAQEAISKIIQEQASDRLYQEDGTVPHPVKEIPDTDKEIFISYSRKDKEVVQTIYERLEKAGYKCWMDIDGMFSGVSYKKVIVDAIKQSKVMLFMSSEHSNRSRNVVSEVSVAMEYGKKIIPIRLDLSSYSESIEYDIINHDYVVYDRTRVEESNQEMLKKIASTLKMV